MTDPRPLKDSFTIYDDSYGPFERDIFPHVTSVKVGPKEREKFGIEIELKGHHTLANFLLVEQAVKSVMAGIKPSIKNLSEEEYINRPRVEGQPATAYVSIVGWAELNKQVEIMPKLKTAIEEAFRALGNPRKDAEPTPAQP